MARLMFSSCGVLAEIAHLDTVTQPEFLLLTGCGLLLTSFVWWSDLLHYANRVVGTHDDFA